MAIEMTVQTSPVSIEMTTEEETATISQETATTIKGDKGEKGDKGDKGDTGDTGNGIANTQLNADYTLTITYTDGTSTTTSSIRGAQGETGPTGATGATGATGPQGDKGDKGDTGEKGDKGDKGDTGAAATVVQTTGTSTDNVMSQNATTNAINQKPIYEEVVSPKAMLVKAGGNFTRRIQSVKTFSWGDIRNIKTFIRSSWCGTEVNHYRGGNTNFCLVCGLYKDENNFCGIVFSGYEIRLINRANGTYLNDIKMGSNMQYNINSVNCQSLMADFDIAEGIARLCYYNPTSKTIVNVPANTTYDISDWDFSHMDTFTINTGISEYNMATFLYHIIINDKFDWASYLKQNIEYGNYNCYYIYPRQTTITSPIITTTHGSGYGPQGTLIEEISDIHKTYRFECTSYGYFGLGFSGTGSNTGQKFVMKVKFHNMSDGWYVSYSGAFGEVDIWKGDTYYGYFNWQASSQQFPIEEDVEYIFVVSRLSSSSGGNISYPLRAYGTFDIEVIDAYYMTPQSANICAETYDGSYFKGNFPFIAYNGEFTSDYSAITTSKGGQGVPKDITYEDSSGNYYIYTGTTWKRINNA